MPKEDKAVAADPYIVAAGTIVVGSGKTRQELKVNDEIPDGALGEDEIPGLVAAGKIIRRSQLPAANAGQAIELSRVRDELAAMTVRAESAEAAKVTLEQQVAGLRADLAALKGPAAAPSAPAPAAT